MSAQQIPATPPSPVQIFNTVQGHQRAFALKAAVDLDLFTAIAKGSRVYQAREVGLCFGGIALTPRASLLVRGGVNEQPGEPTVGDLSVELSASF